MDALRSLNVGWQIAGVVFVVLLVGWLMADPIPHPATPLDWSTLTPEQQAYYRKMFETPILTPDEWEARCGTKYDFGPNERGQGHCSIQVVVDCPPDCGVYKILQEDRLLRRIW